MALFKCNSCNQEYEDYYPPDDICTKCNVGTIRIVTPQGGNTMTAITPTIKLFTSKNNDNTGIHINNLIIDYDSNYYSLQGATNDTIHVFTESIALYVLSINSSNGTIGLNAFMTPEPDPINSLYLHDSKEIRDYLGNKWERMKPVAIVKQLINYLY